MATAEETQTGDEIFSKILKELERLASLQNDLKRLLEKTRNEG